MDPVFEIPRGPCHSLVPWHPPLRHGVRGHPLRAGRAHLQRAGQLPQGGDHRVPGLSESLSENQPHRAVEVGRDPSAPLDEH